MSWLTRTWQWRQTHLERQTSKDIVKFGLIAGALLLVALLASTIAR